jgi:tRNA-dihydrouridine synthase 3
MALALNLLQGHPSEWALTKRHPSEDCFGIQICGAQPDVMTKCAELLEETVSMDFLDINMGCPIDLVCNKGAGSALLDNTRRMHDIIWAVNSALDHTPLTVKLRIGKSETKPMLHTLTPKLHDWGASAIMVRGLLVGGF